MRRVKAWEREHPATAQGDLALTQVVLKSNRVSSKSLQVPAAVLRSFAVEAEPLIMSMLAESAGRRKAAQYANGTGTAPQSTGIRTALGVAAYQHTLSVKYDISDGNWNKSAAGTAGNQPSSRDPHRDAEPARLGILGRLAEPS